jgi:hypothetical protein
MASDPVAPQTDKEILLQFLSPSAPANAKTLHEWDAQLARYAKSRQFVILALLAWMSVVACLAFFVAHIPIFVLFIIFLVTCLAVIGIDLKNIKKILGCPVCRQVPFLIEEKGFLRFKKTIAKDKSTCLHCGARLTS